MAAAAAVSGHLTDARKLPPLEPLPPPLEWPREEVNAKWANAIGGDQSKSGDVSKKPQQAVSGAPSAASGKASGMSAFTTLKVSKIERSNAIELFQAK